MIKNRLLKGISSITVFCFLATQTAGAVPAGGISLLPQQETPAFLRVEIPQEMATIDEIYEAPPRQDPRLILHIQDLHGSYTAQQKIKELLGYLYEKYNFKLMFVEGAYDQVNADILKLFPDQERNIQLADSLAQEGELSGSELFLVEKSEAMEAVGIEDPELYKLNYEAFRNVQNRRSEIDQFLVRFEQRLETYSSRFFSRDMRRLVHEWKKFEKGHRDFLPYVNRLSEEAKKFLGLDLESLFAQVEWPQITRLLVLQSMEEDLNVRQAQAEQKRLVLFLKEKRVSPELIRAIQQLDEKKIIVSRMDSEEERMAHLPRYLLERLVEEAGPKGFYFHDYPAFSLHAGYLILKSELDSKALFDEIEKIFKKILDELAVSEREKNLLELYRDQDLLTKLLHLELTREEWGRATYRREWIKPNSIESRLRGIGAEDSLFLDQISNLDQTDQLLSEVFDTAFGFYDYARKRETAFYKTIQQNMQSRNADKAILVTGGFHTEGLLEIFREEKINYGVLTPRITTEVNNSEYLTAMMETRPTMFDFATIADAFVGLKDPALMGRSTRSEARLIVDRFVQVVLQNPTSGQVRQELESLAGTAYGRLRQTSIRHQKDEGTTSIFDVTVPGDGANNSENYKVSISPVQLPNNTTAYAVTSVTQTGEVTRPPTAPGDEDEERIEETLSTLLPDSISRSESRTEEVQAVQVIMKAVEKFYGDRVEVQSSTDSAILSLSKALTVNAMAVAPNKKFFAAFIPDHSIVHSWGGTYTHEPAKLFIVEASSDSVFAALPIEGSLLKQLTFSSDGFTLTAIDSADHQLSWDIGALRASNEEAVISEFGDNPTATPIWARVYEAHGLLRSHLNELSDMNALFISLSQTVGFLQAHVTTEKILNATDEINGILSLMLQDDNYFRTRGVNTDRLRQAEALLETAKGLLNDLKEDQSRSEARGRKTDAHRLLEIGLSSESIRSRAREYESGRTGIQFDFRLENPLREILTDAGFDINRAGPEGIEAAKAAAPFLNQLADEMDAIMASRSEARGEADDIDTLIDTVRSGLHLFVPEELKKVNHPEMEEILQAIRQVYLAVHNDYYDNGQKFLSGPVMSSSLKELSPVRERLTKLKEQLNGEDQKNAEEGLRKLIIVEDSLWRLQGILNQPEGETRSIKTDQTRRDLRSEARVGFRNDLDYFRDDEALRIARNLSLDAALARVEALATGSETVEMESQSVWKRISSIGVRANSTIVDRQVWFVEIGTQNELFKNYPSKIEEVRQYLSTAYSDRTFDLDLVHTQYQYAYVGPAQDELQLLDSGMLVITVHHDDDDTLTSTIEPDIRVMPPAQSLQIKRDAERYKDWQKPGEDFGARSEARVAVNPLEDIISSVIVGQGIFDENLNPTPVLEAQINDAITIARLRMPKSMREISDILRGFVQASRSVDDQQQLALMIVDNQTALSAYRDFFSGLSDSQFSLLKTLIGINRSEVREMEPAVLTTTIEEGMKITQGPLTEETITALGGTPDLSQVVQTIPAAVATQGSLEVAARKTTLNLGPDLLGSLGDRSSFEAPDLVSLLAYGIFPIDQLTRLTKVEALIAAANILPSVDQLETFFRQAAYLKPSSEWGGVMTLTTQNPSDSFADYAAQSLNHPNKQNTIVYVVEEGMPRSQMKDLQDSLNNELAATVGKWQTTNGAINQENIKRLTVVVTDTNGLFRVVQRVPRMQLQTLKAMLGTAVQGETVGSFMNRFSTLVVGSERGAVRSLADYADPRSNRTFGLDLADAAGDLVRDRIGAATYYTLRSVEAEKLDQETLSMLERDRQFSFFDNNRLSAVLSAIRSEVRAAIKIAMSA